MTKRQDGRTRVELWLWPATRERLQIMQDRSRAPISDLGGAAIDYLFRDIAGDLVFTSKREISRIEELKPSPGDMTKMERLLGVELPEDPSLDEHDEG